MFPQMRMAVDSGLVVCVGLKFPKGNFHSVRIKQFLRGNDGRVSLVRYYDPSPGDTRDLPASDFVKYVEAGSGGMDDTTVAIAVLKR